MTVYNKDYAEGSYVMVLEDCDTYSSASGCCVVQVLWDNQTKGEEALTSEEFEKMVVENESFGRKIWVDTENLVMGEVVEIYV